jgi:C-terminal processing protease CtpA/Prc
MRFQIAVALLFICIFALLNLISSFCSSGQDNNAILDPESIDNILDLALKRHCPTYTYKELVEIRNRSISHKANEWQGTEEQKLLGLLQVYSQVQQYYAGFELHPELNWKNLIIQSINPILEINTIEEYYRQLQKIVAKLEDNHSLIMEPKSMREKYDRPPIAIEFIENKFIIVDTEEYTGYSQQVIRPGLEIKKVEGNPTLEFFQQHKLPYLSLSTIERERYYDVDNLLEGESTIPVTITLCNPQGEESELTLPRDSKLYKTELPLVEMKEINSGIIYFNFRAFWPLKVVRKEFEDKFDQLDLDRLKGLIFDVRDNSGGNSQIGYSIIARLIDKPIKAGCAKIRVRGAVRARTSNPFLLLVGHLYTLFEEWHIANIKIKPSSKSRFLGPVVVLTSRHTGSAAEQFVSALKENKVAVIIGETTKGGTGDGVYSLLPGNGILRVNVAIGAYLNGEAWQGEGIEPVIKVSKNIEDILEGYDSILEKALEILRERTKGGEEK